MSKAYTPEQKSKCYEDYISTRLTLKEIAKAHKVDSSAIQYWITNEKWKQKKDKLSSSLIENANHAFMEHVGKERLQTARRHIEVARRIEESIKQRLERDDDGKPRYYHKAAELAVLAKALKDVSDVDARASGLTDKSSPEGEARKLPLIMVGLQPQPIGQQVGKTINITEAKADPF